MSHLTRHTVEVRPEMHRIGPGPNSGVRCADPQGYVVHFYRAGEFVESRSYGYNQVDEQTMCIRILNWVRDGEL